MFGNQRPDIATTAVTLYDMDLAESLSVSGSSIGVQPGLPAAPVADHMVLLFGYVDIEIELNGAAKVVRVACATRDGMQRGDVLLKSSGGAFQWLDTSSSQLVSTRPEEAQQIAGARVLRLQRHHGHQHRRVARGDHRF